MLITLRQMLRRLQHDEDGAALVEMTLITPFMLLLSAGVFEFSNIIHTRLLVEAGVEDAARYIARCNTLANCVTNGKNLAVNGAVTGGTARVSGWSTTDVSVCFSPIAVTPISGGLSSYRASYSPTLAATDYCSGQLPAANSLGYVVIVNVSTNYNYTGSGLWGYLGFGALQLSMLHQERVIGW